MLRYSGAETCGAVCGDTRYCCCSVLCCWAVRDRPHSLATSSRFGDPFTVPPLMSFSNARGGSQLFGSVLEPLAVTSSALSTER